MIKGQATLKVRTGQIRQRALKELRERIWLRAIAMNEEVAGRVGKYLKDVFDQTTVARALRGGGNTDLAAEFGLTDSQASGLADGMAEIIKSSVMLKTGKGALVLRVQAVPSKWDEYRALPGAFYFSNGHPIPVMDWMLTNPNIDWAEAVYDIAYADDWGMLPGSDQSIVIRSRSGRAIMVRTERLKALGIPHRAGGYVLPDIVRGIAGKNFIEYTISQPEVAEHAMKLALETLGE